MLVIQGRWERKGFISSLGYASNNPQKTKNSNLLLGLLKRNRCHIVQKELILLYHYHHHRSRRRRRRCSRGIVYILQGGNIMPKFESARVKGNNKRIERKGKQQEIDCENTHKSHL